MRYTLSQHGDSLEQRLWPLLKGTWPNYELFWQEFVVPLTERPHSIRLRQGIDPVLEEMCIAHYSIFYHLARAHELFRSLERKAELPKSYDDVFFHLSAATEMVDRFLFALWKIQGKVQVRPDPEPLSPDEVLERASGFHSREYRKSYDRYLANGKSVAIQLHNVRDLVSSLVAEIQAGELIKAVWGIADYIRSYRNVMTHNPLIAKVTGPEQTVCLPKQDRLSKYKLWSDVFFSETAQSDYVAASDIVQDHAREFESRVNDLWEESLKLLRGWSKTEQYKWMLPPDRQGFEVATSDGVERRSLGEWTRGMRSAQVSGTASAFQDTPDADEEDVLHKP